MNTWTKKSFNLYNDDKYLDKLHDIYPMLDNETRDLNHQIIQELEKYFMNKDNKNLFKLLLKQEKFPVKDSYKAFFGRIKKDELDSIIDKNPETVNRICERIYKDSFEKMIEKISEPKETNRQIGPMFPNWLRKIYKSYSDPYQFLNANDDICILNASDAALVDFATNHLKCILPIGTDSKEKGLDLVAKINTNSKTFFVIGEAKFLTDFGGHQNAQLNDALALILFDNFKHKNGINVIRLAILDGVCWINTSNDKMVNRLRNLPEDKIAISALLLDDFFKSLC